MSEEINMLNLNSIQCIYVLNLAHIPSISVAFRFWNTS